MGMTLGPAFPVLDMRLRFRVMAVGLPAKACSIGLGSPRGRGHDLGPKGRGGEGLALHARCWQLGMEMKGGQACGRRRAPRAASQGA